MYLLSSLRNKIILSFIFFSVAEANVYCIVYIVHACLRVSVGKFIAANRSLRNPQVVIIHVRCRSTRAFTAS